VRAILGAGLVLRRLPAELWRRRKMVRPSHQHDPPAEPTQPRPLPRAARMRPLSGLSGQRGGGGRSSGWCRQWDRNNMHFSMGGVERCLLGAVAGTGRD
jgi:hypothetical protein